MLPIIDTLEKALEAAFAALSPATEAAKPDQNDRYTMFWDVVQRYGLDEGARVKMGALCIVDQGQRFAFKTSLNEVTWRIAIEFSRRCNKTDDVRTVVNTARAEIWRFMMTDVAQNETDFPLIDDVIPVSDEVFVDRGDHYGEGVIVFDLKYRTKADDIRRSYS